jgi:hypothetical protein
MLKEMFKAMTDHELRSLIIRIASELLNDLLYDVAAEVHYLVHIQKILPVLPL